MTEGANEEIILEQRQLWDHFYKQEASLYKHQKLKFPARANHSFSGFPAHFTTADSQIVNAYLWSTPQLESILELPVEHLVFTVNAKVYPLVAGLVSVWVFMGCQVPWILPGGVKRHMK
eukprot:GHVR01069116.1.p1 GENE.GHVR01069116.1~~GHVR01069116.1.p1  ORF type:complete len:119 (+),score=21.46 GHVR01069116.1:198-554(+)